MSGIDGTLRSMGDRADLRDVDTRAYSRGRGRERHSHDRADSAGRSAISSHSRSSEGARDRSRSHHRSGRDRSQERVKGAAAERFGTQQEDQKEIVGGQAGRLQNNAWRLMHEKGSSKKDHEEALEIADQGVKLYPNSTRLWDVKALAEIKLGKFQDAEVSAKKALDAFPQNDGAKYHLGIALLRLEKYGETINCLKDVIPKKEDAYEKILVAINGLGETMLKELTIFIDDIHKKLEKLDQVHKEKCRNLLCMAITKRANIYFSKGDWKAAAEDFYYLNTEHDFNSAENDRKFVEALLKMGELLGESHNGKTLDILNRVIEQNRQIFEGGALLLRALVLLRQRGEQVPHEDINEGTKLSPNNQNEGIKSEIFSLLERRNLVKLIDFYTCADLATHLGCHAIGMSYASRYLDLWLRDRVDRGSEVMRIYYIRAWCAYCLDDRQFVEFVNQGIEKFPDCCVDFVFLRGKYYATKKAFRHAFDDFEYCIKYSRGRISPQAIDQALERVVEKDANWRSEAERLRKLLAANNAANGVVPMRD